MSTNNVMRIMSFNIRYDNPEDGCNAWKYRKDMAASMLRFHQADIAGLQEVLVHQLKDLAERLPEYGWVGVGRDDGEKEGEFAPIFYRKDRFTALDHGVFWLSETPDVPGSRGWDAACVRIATWVKFADKQTGKSFYCFNAHFDHEGRTAMRESAHLLLERVESLVGGLPVVLTGDFNSTEDSETYGVLTGRNSALGLSGKTLRDACYESENGHHGPSITFHDFEAAEILLRMSHKSLDPEEDRDEETLKLIDFIFIKNNMKVLQHGTLADTWDGRYPSDHMPVAADLLLY